MLQTEIKRIRLQAEPVLDSFPDITGEAAAVLGYQCKPGEGAVADPLLATLRALEIDVLDWRDVYTYQLEERHKAERQALERDLLNGVFDKYGFSSRHQCSWVEHEVEKYTSYIPPHVLHKAIEIKRALPEVSFVVEKLHDTPDPFLVARVKDGEYRWFRHYIEVWDEPGLERR